MCIRDSRNAVRNKFESMGYKLDDEQLNLVFEAVKQLADRKKTLHDGYFNAS